jgi:hypothetical protein
MNITWGIVSLKYIQTLEKVKLYRIDYAKDELTRHIGVLYISSAARIISAYINRMENFESCFHGIHMIQSLRSIVDQKLRRPKHFLKHGGPNLWGEAAIRGRVITL